MDADGDGRISRDEWLQFFDQMFDEILSKNVEKDLMKKSSIALKAATDHEAEEEEKKEGEETDLADE